MRWSARTGAGPLIVDRGGEGVAGVGRAVALPCAGAEMTPTVAGSRLPSTSLSLDRTSAVAAVSSGVVFVAGAATGASLTDTTVTVTVDVRQALLLSQTVTSKESGPL